MVQNGIRIGLRPVHPGEFLREEVIKGYRLTVTAAAAALGVSRQALSELLNERTSLSPEMALRVDKAFGLRVETMMGMQSDFDIAGIRARASQIKVAKFKGRGSGAGLV